MSPDLPADTLPARDISRLIAIMAALRTPGSGCPWDLEQTFTTVASYTVEEAYEVVDAINRGDMGDLCDELGDLLLQVVFHARMAEEAGAFSFGNVVEAISDKLIRRHPHVFGEARDLSPAQVKALWHQIKAEERRARAERRRAAGLAEDVEDRGVLAGIPLALPALMRAWKLQAKASTVGFDWNDARLVLDKVREETDEVAEALGTGDKARIGEEIGDLLFAAANLARHVGIDPEACLAAANLKFERRFAGVEAGLLAAGTPVGQASLPEMEAMWGQVKRDEKSGESSNLASP